jgi:hypothetical protein
MVTALEVVTAVQAVTTLEAVIEVASRAVAVAPAPRDLPVEASHRRITPRQNRLATSAAGVAVAMAGVAAIAILAADIRTAAVTRSSKPSRRGIMRTECSTA